MATLSGGVLVDSAALEVTRDALFGGSVVLFQPPRGAGYRTNVDALLLAGFAASPRLAPAPRGESHYASRPAGVAFDMGAGVGAVGLALLRFGAAKRVVFIEIDEAPAAMARRNLDANGWADRGEVIRGDVRDVARARRGEATLVVCNPPYLAPGRGRVSAAESRARVGDLGAFVSSARQVAGRRARVCFVYPAHELSTLLTRLALEGLHPKRLRFVHALAKAPARIALVEARAGRPGGLAILPPLVEHEVRGYTPEMESLLASG
ncbi:MAG: methyltransferase [Polyangiaceae bacterium]|jgi:tRNA1Val (adenine37-N6)-methyltransferase